MYVRISVRATLQNRIISLWLLLVDTTRWHCILLTGGLWLCVEWRQLPVKTGIRALSDWPVWSTWHTMAAMWRWHGSASYVMQVPFMSPACLIYCAKYLLIDYVHQMYKVISCNLRHHLAWQLYIDQTNLIFLIWHFMIRYYILTLFDLHIKDFFKIQKWIYGLNVVNTSSGIRFHISDGMKKQIVNGYLLDMQFFKFYKTVLCRIVVRYHAMIIHL